MTLVGYDHLKQLRPVNVGSSGDAVHWDRLRQTAGLAQPPHPMIVFIRQLYDLIDVGLWAVDSGSGVLV